MIGIFRVNIIKMFTFFLFFILFSMNNKLDRLEDIKKENIVWIIYIGIIILSYYANSKEKKYILYNDEKSKKEYQNLMIIIFSILFVIYYYFTKDSYDDLKSINIFDTKKKKNLLYLSFVGSLLILISGVIFLIIAIVDDEIDTEIAFN